MGHSKIGTLVNPVSAHTPGLSITCIGDYLAHHTRAYRTHLPRRLTVLTSGPVNADQSATRHKSDTGCAFWFLEVFGRYFRVAAPIGW
jgi:hypothetical protein